MANFFKDYQAQIKKEKEVENLQENKCIEYNQGQIVYIQASLWSDKNKHKKYFADYLDDGYMLLADNKKDALNGFGRIYHESIIVTH